MPHDARRNVLEKFARLTERRTFVAWLAALLPALAVARGIVAPWRRRDALGARRRAAQPNVAILAALAATVLPQQLGPDGLARAALRFRRWMDEYRPDEELNHGYGTARIGRTPADPRPRWREQLGGLDTDARRAHGQAFVELDLARRQALVRAALAAETGETLPAPALARHVAVAMLAHFYESTLATDLCYEAEIGRHQCRPLEAQARKPIPLLRRS